MKDFGQTLPKVRADIFIKSFYIFIKC